MTMAMALLPGWFGSRRSLLSLRDCLLVYDALGRPEPFPAFRQVSCTPLTSTLLLAQP